MTESGRISRVTSHEARGDSSPSSTRIRTHTPRRAGRSIRHSKVSRAPSARRSTVVVPTHMHRPQRRAVARQPSHRRTARRFRSASRGCVTTHRHVTARHRYPAHAQACPRRSRRVLLPRCRCRGGAPRGQEADQGSDVFQNFVPYLAAKRLFQVERCQATWAAAREPVEGGMARSTLSLSISGGKPCGPNRVVRLGGLELAGCFSFSLR